MELGYALPYMTFLLVFCRSFGIFILSPLMAYPSIPLMVRFLITLGISLIFTFILTPTAATPILLLTEIIIGYLLGFGFHLIIEMMRLSGLVLDQMTGFYFDIPVFSHIYLLLAFLLIFITNTHHSIIRIISTSYEVIPLNSSSIPINWFLEISKSLSFVYLYGIKTISIPIMIILSIIAGVGFISRSLHIFNLPVLAYPLRIIGIFYAISVGVTFIIFNFKQFFFQLSLLLENIFQK